MGVASVSFRYKYPWNANLLFGTTLHCMRIQIYMHHCILILPTEYSTQNRSWCLLNSSVARWGTLGYVPQQLGAVIHLHQHTIANRAHKMS